MRLNFWKKEPAVEESFNEDGSSLIRVSMVEDESTTIEYGQTEAPPDNIYSKISRFSIYLAIFLTPLFYLSWTTNVLEVNKQMLLLVLGGVGLVAWLLSVVSSSWISWRPNKFILPVLGIFAATVLATLFSEIPFKSIFGTSLGLNGSLATVAVLTVFYFLLVSNAENKGEFLRSILGLSMVIALFYGVLQIFGVHLIKLPFASSKSFNSIGTLNSLGFLAAIALPFFSKNSINLKWFERLYLEKFGIVFSFILIFLLNWWAIWLVVVVGMVSMMVFEIISGEKFKMSKVLLPMTVIVLAAFFILIRPNLANILTGLPVEVSISQGLSADIIKEVLKKDPVFGYGPENYSLVFDRFGTSKISNTTLSGSSFVNSSSEFFNLISENGIIGLLAWLYLLFVIGWSLFNFYRDGKVSEGDHSKSDVGLYASLLALVVVTFLYPFNITLSFIFYTLLALTSVSIWHDKKRYYNIEERTSLSLMSSLGFIGGLILVLVGAYFGGTTYLAEVRYASSLVQTDNQVAVEKVVAAINLNGKEDKFYRTASQLAIKLLADEINNKSNRSPEERNSRIQNYLTNSITLARRATEINPKGAENWSNLGVVYQNLLTLVNGADALSEEAFIRAAELRPGDANYYNRIGSVYLTEYELLRQAALRSSGANLTALANQAARALQKSEENFKKAIEVSSNFGLAIYNLGAVYDRQGRVADAIKELETILPSNSNQPGLNFELGLLYYRNNQKDRAFEQLQRSILLAPDYSNARWYLALLYEERGDIDSAISQLDRIVSIDVNKDNQIVLSKLAELRAGQVKSPPGKILDEEPIQ